MAGRIINVIGERMIGVTMTIRPARLRAKIRGIASVRVWWVAVAWRLNM